MESVEDKESTEFTTTEAPVAVDAPDGFRAGEAFSKGRIITPGTSAQLGAFGLFTPQPSQRHVLLPTTKPLNVKSAEDVLWIGFAELCGWPASAEDYRALAEEHRTWVIDGVPSPSHESAVGSAKAWERFSDVVDVLYEQDITLFLIGNGPLDWDIAQDPAHKTNARSEDLARIVSRVSILDRVESSEPFDEIEISGS
ncbi:AFG1/ZapE family ATPase [Arthrobacter sp. NyZ413]|uniref:AFG1/ZapE family ATPase n=1 Tax=Arthrobacter sp. NyZ413 TaxID=3144669 RepID=UPI003BF84612